MEDIVRKDENRKLVKEYPFLKPRGWNNEELNNYDYSYTLLDDLPVGWKRAWGRLFCEDLKQDAIKYGYLDNYYISQAKEKYGSLRWYSNNVPKDAKEHEIVAKYEHISYRTCQHCGKFPVPVLDDGWIYSICKDCYTKNIEERNDKYKPTKTYEDFIQDDSKFDPIVRFTRFSSSGTVITEYDTSDIIKRMKN